ncbi:MAG: ABC transporter ATP-binding protein, partial [Deltaproteobacteria bacterium]|nr:ABC transporter ATP-binding protein [Deltaproteobacteria bacterium]
MPAVELRNIFKSFEIKKGKKELFLHPFRKRYKEVLKDISFLLDGSGICSLIGPNGSGKTTLLRIICGILYPDRGEVLINNMPFSLNPNKVYLISESDKGFFPRLSLINNLRFFASLTSSDKKSIYEKTERIISDFELTNEKDTRFQELSSGTRQRLAIARAMLFNPEILLFDEITKGIDIAQQKLIYTLIRRLRDEGRIIIFATHLLYEAEELTDRIILLYQGRIEGFGPFGQ